MAVVPYSLKDAPALIERLLPVQKLSAEAYKEQMAVQGKTLTALGSYWKGRKPLILNKACIVGCLLPATDNPTKDLEIFEMLMGMDVESLLVRLKIQPKSKDLKELSNKFQKEQSLPKESYRLLVDRSKRPEEVMDTVHVHIWNDVNNYLGTEASNFPQLIEQLGIMRFGHRPRLADTFCGSGQIPFEAARLGCDVFASDLNPIACMLTWGALNIVGGTKETQEKISKSQQKLVNQVQLEIDKLGIETDGHGWRAKVFLYCIEAKCPQTGWIVPLLPRTEKNGVFSSSLVISKKFNVIAELVPDKKNKRYDIIIRSGVTNEEIDKANHEGTLRSDKRGVDSYLIHTVDGIDYKTKISTLRGDYQKTDGTIGNRLRLWEKQDFKPRIDDLFQDRLYCIQWVRSKTDEKGDEYEFRSITPDDLKREKIVEDFISEKIDDWQSKGYIPDMQIEVGGPPRYQGLDLIRARGWMYWHQLFNPRQLLIASLIHQNSDGQLKFGLTQVLNNNSKLSRWMSDNIGQVKGTFDNQALNTLYNYGCRSGYFASALLLMKYKHFDCLNRERTVHNIAASEINSSTDIFITDPPYGDAVKYEEILDFFIAWLRKNPPEEFAEWTWDSRRALAIKGEGEDFRRGMVSAFTRMTEHMPDNGMQVIMFTHQGGPIWADMANIVWASGLQVTAAWYVVTETESALREGSYVKGTVLLVCRKRTGIDKTTRDDLGWDIKEEVEKQVKDLTGLNQNAKVLYRDENVFEDADIQMAGYAAALRVLTKYAIIDGRDMAAEAIRPRVKGEVTFVDELITYAVETANGCLVPQGIEKRYWDKLSGAERFYLKMIDMESRGVKKLDNYQNFMKAFKVRNFKPLMASVKANDARLNSAVDFGRDEMGEGSELHDSVMRAVLYAMMELVKGVESNEVLAHLTFNVPNYYGDITQRELAVSISEYLAKHLEAIRPEEASAARILRELIKNQRM